jgi:hypothetical protein
MNKIARIGVVLTVLLTAMLVFPAGVHAQSGTGDDQLVLGDSYTLESGQTLSGSLVVFGGTVTIKEGATVEGDIFIAGGSLDLRGAVNGSVTSLGSVVDVSDTAAIAGDLSTVGGTVDRAEKAVVKGHIDIGPSNKLNFAKPGDYLKHLPQSPILFDMGPIKDLFGALTRMLGMAALAALVALFLLKPTEHVAQAAVSQPGISLLMGLLSIIVAPALMVLLVITLILSPFGLLGMIILGLAILLGWIAIGYEVGLRMAGSLKVDWAPAIVAGVGTLVLVAASELGGFIPCIGWLIPAFVTLLGLGAVVVSRFGTVSGLPATPVTPSMPSRPATPPSVPPVPPVPPATAPQGPVKMAVEDVDGSSDEGNSGPLA